MKYISLFIIICSQLNADRIVTIGSTATELVFALGCGERVIAVDQSSLHPIEVRDLPQVGYIRMISAEGILALNPSHIIAGEDIGPKETLEKLYKTEIPVTIVKTPSDIDSLIKCIDLLSTELSALDEAKKVKKDIEITVREINIPDQEVSAIFLMHHPYTQAGLNAAGKNTKATKIIELSGGKNLIDSHNGYKAISQESLLLLDPDYIFIGVPENIATEDSEIIKMISGKEIFAHLKAVENNDIHVLPLSQTLSFSHKLPNTIKNISDIFSQDLKNQK